MCLAIAAQAGKRIPEEALVNGWQYNSDGAGLAYVNQQGDVIIDKGHMNLKSLRETYERLFDLNKDSPFLVHFRTCTHGARTPTMTHPFRIGGGSAMIHNGVIRGLGTTEESDTSEFAKVLGKVSSYELPHVITHLKNYFHSTFNKFAFLTPERKLLFINEADGEWDDGIWYSNQGWKHRYTDRGGVRDTASGDVSDAGSMYHWPYGDD